MESKTKGYVSCRGIHAVADAVICNIRNRIMQIYITFRYDICIMFLLTASVQLLRLLNVRSYYPLSPY
jgi:hypothetical protein